MTALRTALAASTLLSGLLPAVAAHAGGGGSGCHSCSVPPPCNCSVPSGHEVYVPGVTISPPSVTVNAPTISLSAPTIEVQSTAIAVANASAEAGANADANGAAYANANGYALSNAIAASNVYAFGGGGGGAYAASEGVSSFLPALNVESVEAPAAARICAQFRSVVRVEAVQAVCLDDKAIPHPASQVMPDREVLPIYEGEVFRCIAGTHMQYTLGAYAQAADFSHGQTVVCAKGEALYHSAAGDLACRPQRPARDCNERSLLRRYGAGIKLVRAAAQQCVAWSTETAAAASGAVQGMATDGGVGRY